jgi:hypothetical protein
LTTRVPIRGGIMHGQTEDASDSTDWIAYDAGSYMAIYRLERYQGKPVYYAHVTRWPE